MEATKQKGLSANLKKYSFSEEVEGAISDSIGILNGITYKNQDINTIVEVSQIWNDLGNALKQLPNEELLGELGRIHQRIAKLAIPVVFKKQMCYVKRSYNIEITQTCATKSSVVVTTCDGAVSISKEITTTSPVWILEIIKLSDTFKVLLR